MHIKSLQYNTVSGTVLWQQFISIPLYTECCNVVMFFQNLIQHIYYKESPIATTDDFDNSDIFHTVRFTLYCQLLITQHHTQLIILSNK
jgi:hypothetical protein